MSAVRSLCVLSARHNTYLAHTVSQSGPYLRTVQWFSSRRQGGGVWMEDMQ
jgi:hypothetical protein